MPRIIFGCLILLAGLGAAVQDTQAGGQGYPGGGGGRPGMGGTQGVGSPPGGEVLQSAPSVDKPDAAATKAYKSAVKSLNKAHEYEEAMAKATNPDKKADELDKTGDAYGKALDYFTVAIMNKGDMVEAWNGAGYVHLRLGAYNEIGRAHV